MQIVCPNCASCYEVDASALGAAGRSVRCTRCRTVWFQTPADEPPAQPEPAGDAAVAAFQSELGSEAQPQAAETAAAASENGDPPGPSFDELMLAPAAAPDSAADTTVAAPALSEIAIPVTEAPPVAPEAGESDKPAAGDIETMASRRGKRGTARRRIPMRPGRLPVLILVLFGVVAALLAWRGSIVRHMPQTASLYAAIGMPVNLRGLVFTEVNVSRDVHEGVAVLMVEGIISSAAKRPVEVPRLRFAMRNEAGAEIYAWTAMPPREVLGPGETMPFRSRLASPPGEGKDVTVRFFTRHDAVAGLR